MPPWDKTFIGYSYLIENASQQAIEDEKNNKDKHQPKIEQKSAKRRCRRSLHHKFFFENFIYDPLNAFTILMGSISIRIVW